MRPIAACADVVGRMHTRWQVTPESPGIPHAMVYGLYRDLPGAPGLLATVACAPSRRLDTSVGVSGPHDFARPLQVLSSTAPSASTASRPAFSDDRETPLIVGRDGEQYRIIRSSVNKNIFSGMA